ncbi:MAG: hypothetical protein M0P41_04810, partial [Sphaerochaeta sp.]|nr:hypothetical protein [Sphaerochaeta sp.]
MADINKTDIKLKASQRLDDTEQGGGQMTATEIVSGAVNNLYPDISRLDRVYGRVSLRKAYLAVETTGRQTYYGSHAALTRNAADPNVSVCFFSSKDWYDTREEAKTRIESYLVRGPAYPSAMWGNHYIGSSMIQMHTYVAQANPEIGDVLVLVRNINKVENVYQFVRVTNLTTEVRTFGTGQNTYQKKILQVEIGEQLRYDFIGREMFDDNTPYTSTQDCAIYTTVAADASRYYGVAQLAEDVNSGSLMVRADSINVPLVPSAQSQTAINDAGVGQAVTPMLQVSSVNNSVPYTKNYAFILTPGGELELGKSIQAGSVSASGDYTFTDNGSGSIIHSGVTVGTIDHATGTILFNDNAPGPQSCSIAVTYVPTTITRVTRSVAYTIANNTKLYLGEGVLPGSFEWTGGIALYDDSAGNVMNAGTVVGSIAYASGTIIFTQVSSSMAGTGVASYIPACEPTEVASTGGIQVEVNNRGFVYTYNCNPLPKKGSVKIDYLAGGKWYSMQDRGDGAIRGYDSAIGSGTVNALTGSIIMTLGAMPDVGSTIMIFWAKDAPYYDLAGDVIPLKYSLKTNNPGVARNTFICSWLTDTFAVMDDGNGNVTVAEKAGENWTATATIVGKIAYATGDVEFKVGAAQTVPSATEDFWIRYSYGDTYKEEFNPIRDANGRVTFYLANAPVVPGTFKIEWHTDQEEYDGTSGIRRHIDPTHIFYDNTLGFFENEVNDGTTNWIPSSINYVTGQITLMPDRKGTFPITRYIWRNTGLFDEDHRELREFVFHSIDYRPAASIWPTDGIIVCDYRCTDGANSDSYYQTIPKQFFIKPNSHLEIVPGSIALNAGGYHIIDIGTGRLFHSIVGTTGVGVECGTINYVDRVVTLTDNNILAKNLAVISCAGTAAIDPVQLMVFRTPGAPITPGSFSVRATLGTGAIIEGTSDFSGEVTGTGITGKIDFSTGVARISFGAWLTDTWSALPVGEQPEWYDGAPIDEATGKVWKPYSVRASTVMVNCVVTSYLPLDATLLGLDPVRLPMDGKVPIFRDGYIVLIHHTVRENLPNPVVNGNAYPLSRGNVELIELYDSTGLYIPEADNGVINYSMDNTVGSITIGQNADFTGYTQPLFVIHRQEDMTLVSDVQITGHMAITSPLKHSYIRDETLISSVLPSADLQARAYNEFVQVAWTGAWEDDQIGTPPLANYNFVDYPITVTNKGATKERWLLKFKTTTTFDVIGEHLGVLLTDVSIGNDGVPVGSQWVYESGQYYLDITNRLTGEKYWRLPHAG